MATSPNYGWLEPDNTDLVKNGALAIRTLGDAIDTTMATMTPKSIVDAKGDLIAASANDTPARLAVGANGETLVADSSTATGLDWKSAAEQYPWQTYSPTTSGFTKGNGTEVARYQQIGKTVFIDYSFTFGSTSAMTGLVQIGMPVTPAAAMQFNPCGNVMFEDKDTQFYLGSCVVQAYDWINVYIDKADGTYTREGYTSATVPFTWGNTDRFFLSVSYEAA